MDKVSLHQDLCRELSLTYEKKNSDYGDSFSRARHEIPQYTLGKIYDKFSRYKNLTNHDTRVDDESIEDTLLDMANYCIMEVMERRIDRMEETE